MITTINACINKYTPFPILGTYHTCINILYIYIIVYYSCDPYQNKYTSMCVYVVVDANPYTWLCVWTFVYKCCIYVRSILLLIVDDLSQIQINCESARLLSGLGARIQYIPILLCLPQPADEGIYISQTRCINVQSYLCGDEVGQVIHISEN